MSCRRHQLASPDALKYIYEAFLFCVSSLLQCLRVRIRAKIFRPDLGTVKFPPLLHLVAHLPINANLLTSMYRCSFAKTFWILLCHEVRAQKLIHNKNSMLFSQPRFYLTFPLSCVWNSAMFPIMFYKLFNANSTVFLFSEAVAQRCSVKKMFLEISQNSQENPCARASFLEALRQSRF